MPFQRKETDKIRIERNCRFLFEEPACIARIRCEGSIGNLRIVDIRIGNLSILLFESIPLWVATDTDIRIPYVCLPGVYYTIILDRDMPESKMWVEYYPQKLPDPIQEVAGEF